MADIIESLRRAKFEPEVAEVRRKYYDYTGYPKPAKKYVLAYKSANYSVEEMYQWMIGHLMTDQGVPYVHKITDVFAASQGSSIFGDLQARLSAQQNQSSQLLATTSAMTKDLFKRVRELRQIRERLAYYDIADAKKPAAERKKSAPKGAENTLKDTWITLVEGGAENASSVYGMARKVNFTVLPDLFFQAPPMKSDEVKAYVDALDFNPAVKMALERKLYQFIIWKDNTYKELVFKERFQKKLIFQHYQNIKTYLGWIKPYLKNIKRLSNNDELMDSHVIISSFQTSLIEIEVLLQKPIKKIKPMDEKVTPTEEEKKDLIHNAVVLIHFLYETAPTMDFHAKDSWQQKGPIHVGRVDATIRAYGWTNKEIEKYKKLKSEEELGLLEAIDYTLKDEAELLGDDLKEVLDEIQKDLNKKVYGEEPESEDAQRTKEKQRIQKDALAPFTGIFKGLKEVFVDPFSSGFNISFSSGASDKYKADFKSAKKEAEAQAKFLAWMAFNNYKKSHGMISW